jgi:hypothetical protein
LSFNITCTNVDITAQEYGASFSFEAFCQDLGMESFFDLLKKAAFVVLSLKNATLFARNLFI